MNKKIAVFISDDHLLLLDGLVSMLNETEGIQVVGIANNGKETIDKIGTSKADVLICDYQMPDMDGQEVLRFVKRHYPKIKVLMLSMHENIGDIKKLLEYGASGYMLKNTRREEFVMAIRRVNEGEKYFSPSLAYKVLKSLDNPMIHKDSLSNQELKVAKKLAQGFSSQEIADSMCLSINTVNTYRKRIYGKLHLKGLPDLIRFGAQKGWLSDID